VNPRMYFDIAMAILVALLVAGIIWGYQEFQSMQDKIKTMESTATVTSEATDALSTANQAKQDIHFTIEDNRATQDANYEKLLRSDQSAKSWANTELPASVRESDGGALDGPENSPTGRGVADPEN